MGEPSAPVKERNGAWARAARLYLDAKFGPRPYQSVAAALPDAKRQLAQEAAERAHACAAAGGVVG